MATMNIIQAMNRLRSDIQTWVANNLKTKVNADDLSTSVTTGTISANQIFINGDDVKNLLDALSNKNDAQDATISTLATKEDLNKKLDSILASETYVPKTRKINGVALDKDITINATDPNAATKDELNALDSSLATVAKSGSYNDLTNKPTIPSAVTDTTVGGWGYMKKTSADSAYAAKSLENTVSLLQEQFDDLTATGGEPNVQSNWNETNTSSDAFIKNKPDLSVYETKANATATYAPKTLADTVSQLSNTVSGKQDKINDLSTIRSGASAGATALQPGALNGYLTTAVANGKYATIDTAEDLQDNIEAVEAKIPTVNNGKITIKQNNSEIGSFTLNQSGNKTIELTDSTYSATDANPNLTWGTKSKVATVCGTDIHVTMPAKPTFTEQYTGTITGVTAGKGLTGGATSGNATLNVGAGAGISVGDDAVAVNIKDTTKNSKAAVKGGNSDKLYAVELDSNGKLAVSVPWTATTFEGNDELEALLEPFALKTDLDAYKTKQSAVSDPSATNETSTTFISSISQDTNGLITATKKKLPVTDVQVNGTSVVTNKIANIDLSGYATKIKINNADVSAINGVIDIGTVAPKTLATHLELGLMKPTFYHTNGTVTLPPIRTTIGNISVQNRTAVSDRYYGVELDAATGAAYVNVPWKDTNYYHKPVYYQANQTAGPNDLKIATWHDTSGANTYDIYVPAASETQTGVVNTGAQTFRGSKTFSHNICLGGATNAVGEIIHGSVIDNAYSTEMIWGSGDFDYLTVNVGDTFARDIQLWANNKVYFKMNTAVPLEVGVSSISARVPVMSSGGFFDTSDERLKNFGGNIQIDFEKLKSIPKKYFTWKDGVENLQIGTSAQAVKEVYPELVNENENGELSVAYNKLSVIALAAVDKLYDENVQLKNDIANLNERLSIIESLLKNVK